MATASSTCYDDLTPEECEAIEAAEAARWESDMAQLRWAEAGGYASGLPRPGYAKPLPAGDWDDIPY